MNDAQKYFAHQPVNAQELVDNMKTWKDQMQAGKKSGESLQRLKYNLSPTAPNLDIYGEQISSQICDLYGDLDQDDSKHWHTTPPPDEPLEF